MAPVNDCPLCEGKLKKTAEYVDQFTRDVMELDCRTCGRFHLPWFFPDRERFDEGIAKRRYLISAASRAQHDPLLVDDALLDRIRKGAISDKSVSEKIALVMQVFEARSGGEVGRFCQVDPDADYPLAWCHNASEWKTLVHVLATPPFSYLHGEDPLANRVEVTVTGWQWLADRPKAKGDVGFVAMAFNKSLDGLRDAIFQGVRAAGYEPRRVDGDEYNGAVVDEIIARIRESRFVVADFTRNRGGVYYEAGFAEGLGTDVFYLCEDVQIGAEAKAEERVHFDIQHQNLITWNREQLALLPEKLSNRIVRVLGRGPHPAAAQSQR